MLSLLAESRVFHMKLFNCFTLIYKCVLYSRDFRKSLAVLKILLPKTETLKLEQMDLFLVLKVYNPFTIR